jgi:hypothetical protein
MISLQPEVTRNMKEQSAISPRIRRLAWAAAAVASTLFALPGLAAPDWDIVGIRLGMTEAEVMQALEAFEPNAQITVSNAVFSYYDGVAYFETPDFLNNIRARVGGPSLGNGVTVWFSGPIGEARVIAVARRHFDGSASAPTLTQFEQSLQAKYRTPGALYEGPGSPVWEEEGKPSCIRIAEQGNQTRPYLGSLFMSTAQTSNDPDNIENTIDGMRARGAQGLLPADLATCGAFVFYRYHVGDPVVSFTAGMFDVGAMIATERSRFAWVESLEAEAVQRRQGQGQAPRL